MRTEKALPVVVVEGALAPSTYDPPQLDGVSKPDLGRNVGYTKRLFAVEDEFKDKEPAVAAAQQAGSAGAAAQTAESAVAAAQQVKSAGAATQKAGSAVAGAAAQKAALERRGSEQGRPAAAQRRGLVQDELQEEPTRGGRRMLLAGLQTEVMRRVRRLTERQAEVVKKTAQGQRPCWSGAIATIRKWSRRQRFAGTREWLRAVQGRAKSSTAKWLRVGAVVMSELRKRQQAEIAGGRQQQWRRMALACQQLSCCTEQERHLHGQLVRM